MDKCWANILGDCDGGISREHTISRSLFVGPYVDIIGLPWCKDEKKRIGLGSLTQKILCRKHNAELSQIDRAGSHAFDVLRRQTALTNKREKKRNKKYKKIIFSINATGLERWLLKTLINISYDGDYYIGKDSDRKGWPSDSLVKIAFGKESFKDGNGMYVAYKLGGTISSTDSIGFAPIIKDDKHIYGGIFSFRGVLLYLDISPDGVKIPFKEIPGTDPEWHDVQLSKPFKRIRAEMGGKLSHVVKFNWV